MELQEIARLLEKGIEADICYDAEDHNDEKAVKVITEVQEAMKEAAEIFREVTEVL